METRSVMVRERVLQPVENSVPIVVWAYQGVATFHGFGVNYEEFEGGPGNYSTATIEWPNGQVESVPVDHIRFLVPTVVAEGGTAISADAKSPKIEPTAASAPIGH